MNSLIIPGRGKLPGTSCGCGTPVPVMALPCPDAHYILPNGGEEGQVLTKKSDADQDVEWRDVPIDDGNGEGSGGHIILDETTALLQRPKLAFKGRTITATDNGIDDTTDVTVIDEVPAGGTTGQVLGKASNTDFDLSWQTPIRELPPGGGVGQVLAKTSATDYVVGWQDVTGGGGTNGHIIQEEGTPLTQQPVLNFKGRTVTASDNAGATATDITIADEIPAGGTVGQVLTKTGATDYQIGWQTPSGGPAPGVTGHIIQEEGSSLAQQPVLNFKGRTVTATNNAGTTATDVTIADEIPAGGAAGQVLTKTSATNYAYSWVDVPKEIPTGGAVNQVLTKTGTADFAMGWRTPTTAIAGHQISDDGESPLPQRPKLNFVGAWVTATDNSANNSSDITVADQVPTGGTQGQVLTKVNAADTGRFWRDVGAYPIKFATGGTKDNTAIQVDGQADRGIYYDPVALNYNAINHPAWLTSFDGKSGPGIFDFGIWLPVPPISSNPTNPSSSGYLLWGPLIAGAGLWFSSTFRLPSIDAPGKTHSWWGLNWIADGGLGTAQQWFNVSKDYPKQAGQPAFNWTEDSRSFISFGAGPTGGLAGGSVVIPNGTLALVGMAHGRNFFKEGSANTGWSSLNINQFSAIAEGTELMTYAQTALTVKVPLIVLDSLDLGVMP